MERQQAGHAAPAVPGLLTWHAHLLRQSAISDDVIRERGYQTVSRPTAGDDGPRELLRRCGMPKWLTEEDARYPGLLIPQYHPAGTLTGWLYRPDVHSRNPDGKLLKYVQAAKQPSVADVHPRSVAAMPDPTVPLFVTEGTKKADALVSAGACAVSVSGVYNWRSARGALPDFESIALRGRHVYVTFDADARGKRAVAQAMLRFGRWLASRGARVHYLITPATSPDEKTPTKGADDYLAAGGTLAELKAAATTRPPALPGASAETRLAERLSDRQLSEDAADGPLAGRALYTAGLGWMAWDGRRWRPAPEEEITEIVWSWLKNLYAEGIRQAAKKIKDGTLLNEAMRAWRECLKRSKAVSVTLGARGLLLCDAAEFDADPDILNCANGVINLTTAELMRHDPAFMCTRITHARYVAGAVHRDWDKALRAIPRSCRDWYKIRCGQAITGHMTPDDKVIIQHGGGENGKTTIALGIKAALGDYYLNVPHRALLADPRQHPTELMDFRGARFAVLEELPEDGRLSAVRLKMLAGNPYITARPTHKDDVTFPATHSLQVNTNHRPIVDETTHAAWRRLCLLVCPFRYVEPGKPLHGPYERTGDPGLRERVRDGRDGQHEAILEWLVDGAYSWYFHGKRMPPLPERVERDTLEWRCDADLILGYINERVVFDQGWHVLNTELFKDVSAWLADRGHSAWSQKLLTERFGGHEEARKHRVRRARIRPSDERTKVSRSPAAESFHGGLSDPGGDLPGQYTAWVGMRFRVPADDEAS